MQQDNRHERPSDMKSDSAVTVELTLTQHRCRRTRAEGPPPVTPATPHNRLPRITRLMALAIKFQEMVDRGEVRDYAELALLGHVSRARITQIMNLLNLAPDIQEQLMNLRASNDAPSEKQLRKVCSMVRWADQRLAFKSLLAEDETEELRRGRTR
jgi:hypothetical protein